MAPEATPAQACRSLFSLASKVLVALVVPNWAYACGTIKVIFQQLVAPLPFPVCGGNHNRMSKENQD